MNNRVFDVCRTKYTYNEVARCAAAAKMSYQENKSPHRHHRSSFESAVIF